MRESKMMKQRKMIVVGITMAFAVMISGCAKENTAKSADSTVSTSTESATKGTNFTTGKWNGHVFENEWLNMKFTVPDSWKIASDEEISSIAGLASDLVKIDGTSKEQLEQAMKLKNMYSFIVAEPTGSINAQLMYENLALSIGGTSYDEKKYIDAAVNLLLQQKDYQYKVLEQSSVVIANKTFQAVKLSLYNGAMEQMYYCYKQDNFMVNIIVSYQPTQTAAKDNLIKNISILK